MANYIDDTKITESDNDDYAGFLRDHNWASKMLYFCGHYNIKLSC